MVDFFVYELTHYHNPKNLAERWTMDEVGDFASSARKSLERKNQKEKQKKEAEKEGSE
jgi:hypothetical protein